MSARLTNDTTDEFEVHRKSTFSGEIKTRTNLNTNFLYFSNQAPRFAGSVLEFIRMAIDATDARLKREFE